MLRFGIIGCGMIAPVHAGAIKAAGAVLLGAADADFSRASEFAAKHGCRPYRSAKDLAEDGDIDAVCICSPSGLHASLALMCAREGKHIVVEKPLALTVASADEVVAECEKNGVTGTVISQLRYTGDISAARRAVLDGAFGSLISAHLEMRYYRTQQYYDSSGWRGTWAMDGGGALMNQGIHGIDALSYIMGGVESACGEIRTIARRIEVEDTAAAVLVFKNGALGTVSASVAAYPGYPRKITVCGERGSVTLTEDTVTESDIPSLAASAGQGIHSGSSDPANTKIEGHAAQLADFIEAARTGGKTRSDLADGRDTVKIIESIYHSSSSGQKIIL